MPEKASPLPQLQIFYVVLSYGRHSVSGSNDAKNWMAWRGALAISVGDRVNFPFPLVLPCDHKVLNLLLKVEL